MNVGRLAGPAFRLDRDHLAVAANGHLPRGETEQSDAGGILTGFERVFPAGAAQVEQLGKVIDALAVVTDGDEVIFVANYHFRGARPAGVLQDFDDPAVQRPREETIRFL